MVLHSICFFSSRNNSVSQADYGKSGKASNDLMGSPGGSNGVPSFKPVPPPKPKNYRPPIQGGAPMGGQWDSGVSFYLQQQ